MLCAYDGGGGDDDDDDDDGWYYKAYDYKRRLIMADDYKRRLIMASCLQLPGEILLGYGRASERAREREIFCWVTARRGGGGG